MDDIIVVHSLYHPIPWLVFGYPDP